MKRPILFGKKAQEIVEMCDVGHTRTKFIWFQRNPIRISPRAARIMNNPDLTPTTTPTDWAARLKASQRKSAPARYGAPPGH